MSRNPYTATDTATASDSVPLWRPSAGNWYSATLATIASYVGTVIATGVNYTTQYASPSATAFTVTLTARTTDIWLVLTPTAGFAAGTITLPAPGSSYDKQQISVNCTQAVTALTVAGNGATAVTGAPTTLAANDFFTLRYDAVSSTWYRVG